MIEFHNACVSMGNRRIVHRLSLHVAPGECLVLAGPNGAGKSTVLRLAAGLLHASEGWVRTGNTSPAIPKTPAAPTRTAFVPEHPFLYDALTPRQHLAFVGDIFRLPPTLQQERAAFLSDVLGLKDCEHSPIGSLSRGNRQRVALCGALLPDPELLLLDEPFNTLDPLCSAALVQELKRRMHDGMSLLLATHQFSLAEQLSHRVAILCHGSLAAEGTPVMLRSQAGGPHTLEEACQHLMQTHATAEPLPNAPLP